MTSLRRRIGRRVRARIGEQGWELLRDPRGAVLGRRRYARMNLTELAQEFGTDKWGLHRYTPHYERHLAQLRQERFTMLEIGIGGYRRSGDGGASLRMWKAFFPRAQILGLDIANKSFVNAPRIRAYRGSQVDHDVLDRILADAGELQVIIDDGSHRPEHIRETFAYLFPRLAPDGIYAIEDTQTSYWPLWGGSNDLHEASTTMALVKDLLDGLHHEEFPHLDRTYKPTYTDLHVTAVHAYHNLVIIEKGSNREGTQGRSRQRLFPVDDPQHRTAPPIADQRRAWSVPSVPND